MKPGICSLKKKKKKKRQTLIATMSFHKESIKALERTPGVCT